MVHISILENELNNFNATDFSNINFDLSSLNTMREELRNSIEGDVFVHIAISLLVGVKKMGIDVSLDHNSDIIFDENFYDALINFKSTSLYYDEYITPALLRLSDFEELDLIDEKACYTLFIILEGIYRYIKRIDPESVSNVQCLTGQYNNENTPEIKDPHYYKLDPKWKVIQDIIEDRNMNFNQGNILKSSFCFNTSYYDDENYLKALNKIVYCAQREINRITSRY